MIGHAVRLKRLYRGDSSGYQYPSGPPAPNILMERCNLLFVASGVFFIVGTIVLIPGFFGDTNFFLYSASSFGVGLVILACACLCSSLVEKGDAEDRARAATVSHADNGCGTTSARRATTGTSDYSPTASRVIEVETINSIP